LRRLAAAALLSLLTTVGMTAPAAAAGYVSSAKVVIVVGATEGDTARYRSYADQAYVEAIKYTPNVIRVYSPNASWAKVQAAAKGANVLLYYGHGNGWPSPYTYDPKYTTKDGMGLNASTSPSDNKHVYYGEPYVRTLNLAPNAIVLLGNLCYASGNSEPGKAAPTLSQARQRIDNYAAGFLAGNAEAVIADGHGGLVSYVRGLFTSGTTVVEMWKSAPNFHNHVFAFGSTRSPGYTAWSDPDAVSSGFYRSLVTKPTLTTTAVTGVIGTTGSAQRSAVGNLVVTRPEPTEPPSPSPFG
jgi:hypothetical protein